MWDICYVHQSKCVLFLQISLSDLTYTGSYHSDGAGDQITKISWFPPPQSWEGSSYNSIEWTPSAEVVFQSVFTNARLGIFQPLSAKRWRDRLRNFKNVRKAFENNKSRASFFLTREVLSVKSQMG